MSEIVFFVGAPGQGKTTMAQHLAAERAGARMVPCVIGDPEGVLDYEGCTRLTGPCWDELSRIVWTEGEHVIWTPGREEEFANFLHGIRRGGNVVFLQDESSHIADPENVSRQILVAALRLCRAHRLQGIDMYFTTQSPSEIHRKIWNLRTEVYIFNCTGSGALERLEAELELSPEWVAKIRTLPEGKYVKWTRKRSPGGFATKPAPRKKIPKAPEPIESMSTSPPSSLPDSSSPSGSPEPGIDPPSSPV
jgi:hypothetical protein